MTLIQVSIDPVVMEGLFAGMIGTIAAVVGAIALIKATAQARGGPTKAEQGMISVLAGRLSMKVAAQNGMSDPLNLHFTLSDPAVTLLRIEIPNQLDKGARIAQCVKEAPRVFVATVEPKVIQRWYNANPYWSGETKQLPIRLFLRTKGHAGCQTIWVTMSSRTMPTSVLPDVSDFEWLLEGPCSRTHSTLALFPSRTRTERL
jgi:hypothetical protein